MSNLCLVRYAKPLSQEMETPLVWFVTDLQTTTANVKMEYMSQNQAWMKCFELKKSSLTLIKLKNVILENKHGAATA